ncbi:SusC/RagA family TonB-linked outer membrane protein [Solitalea sp. MAHUQ-68]|uniref:SusC/RagA family TonB-linked outer membrane protein n=1 Tax=Solitalea agri TaxID=2953739 RepID=A0A9X2JFL9_9SPHI|nr:SusC/RagA family TonB-linked outer membrane protein [Solitalea agri]MCO4293576.1 SusC/RagA family TonB-linked outer membrane protein [Solitalea agri]
MKRKLPKLLMALGAISLALEPAMSQDLANRAFSGKTENPSAYSEQREPLQHALSTLQEYFKVNIIFEDSSIKGCFTSIDVNSLKDLTIEEALAELVSPLGLRYKKVDEKNYIIKAKKVINKVKNEELESIASSYSTIIATPVKGHVTDKKTGEALPGVSISIKGSSLGTTSDVNGDYTIDVPNESSVLVFSFLGYKPVEITVGKNSIINPELDMESHLLNEVQVVEVGYGTQKKEAVAGSVATISNERIKQMPSVNLGTALAGNTPGLIVAQRGGAPGSEDNSILIRSTSLLATPLIVVDGVARTNASYTNQVGINDIDPNDVESVTVLKDIASTSIYGARGANGVILITTKRGKESPAKFNFSSSTTFSQPTKLPKFLDGYQQALLENERAINSGATAAYSDADLEIIRTNSNPDRYAQTNWAEQGLKKFSNGQNYNLNVTGGNDKMKYYLGGGLNQQKSLLKIDNDFKRYSFISNLDAKIAKNLDVSADINYKLESANTPNGGFGGLYGQLFSQSPLQPVTFSNGLPAAFLTSAQNPVYAAQNGGYALTESNFFTGKIKAKYTVPFVKGFSAEGMLSIDRSTVFNKNFSTPFKLYRADANGVYNAVTGVDAKGNDQKPTLSEIFNKSSFNTKNFSLNYNRSFGKHSVAALAMFESTEAYGERLQASRSNIFSNKTDQLFAGDANITNTGLGYETGRAGYIGRLNYSYFGKYYLEGSYRYEGSTNFPEDKRWGFFPSVAGAWRISEEGFLKNNQHFINNLKLRASYGMAGDESGSGYSAYQTGYSVASTGANGYIWNGAYATSVFAGTSTINPNFTWAKVRSYNIGLDFELWKGLLSGEFDVYNKQAYDLLTPMFTSSATVPLSFGAVAPKQNQGKTHTNGFELSLTHRNQITKNWGYYVTGNISKTKTIIDFSGEVAGLPEWDVNRHNELGANVDRFYKSLGLFQNQAEIDAYPVDQDGQKNKTIKPGDIKYADLNGDGILDTKDVYVVDNSTIPVVNYAFNLGTSYKNISVDLAFVGAADYTNNNLAQTWANFDERQLDRWSVDNPDASWPRLSTSGNNTKKSDFYGTDGSYLRLRSVQLNYSLPKMFIQHLGLDAFTVFVQGGNLLTFSKVKFMDPENNNNWGYYGPQRTFAMGLNVKF